MMAWLTRLACLGALALASGLWVRPALGQENIVLAPLELTGALNVSRVDLEAAVLRGLAVTGRPVVPPAEATSAGTFLVTGSVKRDGAVFRVAFRLVRRADQRELNATSNHCDVADCSLAELARRSARELVRQSLGRVSDQPPPPPPPPAAVPPLKTEPRPAADRGEPSSKLWPGLTLGVGAAAVGAGVYLLAIDGRCTSTPPMGKLCRDFNDTKALGIGAVAGGVVLGAVGAYFLVVDRARDDGPTVSLGITPRGIVAAGRF
jgi:hypothetical protein